MPSGLLKRGRAGLAPPGAAVAPLRNGVALRSGAAGDHQVPAVDHQVHHMALSESVRNLSAAFQVRLANVAGAAHRPMRPGH